MDNTWQTKVSDLLAGPYKGYGGLAALAKELGCSSPTVRRIARGGRPSYRVARQVDRVWEQEGNNVHSRQ